MSSAEAADPEARILVLDAFFTYAYGESRADGACLCRPLLALFLHQTADTVGPMLDATTPASSAAHMWKVLVFDTGPASEYNASDLGCEIVIPGCLSQLLTGCRRLAPGIQSM